MLPNYREKKKEKKKGTVPFFIPIFPPALSIISKSITWLWQLRKLLSSVKRQRRQTLHYTF